MSVDITALIKRCLLTYLLDKRCPTGPDSSASHSTVFVSVVADK